MDEKKRTERSGRKETLLPNTLLTGFIGGLFWSLVGVIMSYFNFTEVSPRTYILRPWLRLAWTDGWIGDVISILIIGIFSIVTALIYLVLFKKVYSMWMGLAFGAILWGIVFYLLQPIFPTVPSLPELNWNSILSTLCLYMLYGIFIGFTISYNYQELKRQPAE
ncbi:hypothetical protein CWR48_08955 [Oceanobacillus arenosus]|uniref:Uncharacterized protein n=1 Tax=Oceanobacillus arenosus TaxID=1229153 RepID=A0A3D8PV63_9BACI|nr:YqhR family membrane protein [Oceanobacillus arenosus]RDW19168.1 hypothetical protein CWR48_08955 [Oceanobacillus arenosus]